MQFSWEVESWSQQNQSTTGDMSKDFENEDWEESMKQGSEIGAVITANS